MTKNSVLGFHIFMHLGALLIFYTATVEIHWWLGLFQWWLKGMSICLFNHHYLSHKNFKMGRIFQFFMAVAATCGGQGGILWWAARHIDHHKYADDWKDPHTPRKDKGGGFWHSHMTWQLKAFDTHKNSLQSVKEWFKFPELVWLSKYFTPFFILQAPMWYYLGEYFGPQFGTNGFQTLVCQFFVAGTISMHATWITASFAHTNFLPWSYRTYDTPDHSVNNWMVGIIAHGTGWHNNHHKYPKSCKMGHRWWEIDTAWMTLKIFQFFGLVWGLDYSHEQTKKNNNKEIKQID